jgi:hypothetical protein
MIKSIVLTALLAAPGVFGHMQMSYPYPFNSSYNPKNDYTNIDYSVTSPLFADGSNFPCKGYQTQIHGPGYPTVDTITAGESYTVS